MRGLAFLQSVSEWKRQHLWLRDFRRREFVLEDFQSNDPHYHLRRLTIAEIMWFVTRPGTYTVSIATEVFIRGHFKMGLYHSHTCETMQQAEGYIRRFNLDGAHFTMGNTEGDFGPVAFDQPIRDLPTESLTVA